MSDIYDDLREALDWNGPTHPGVKAARRYALWHLGDRTWADRILFAFLNPDETVRNLELERAE